MKLSFLGALALSAVAASVAADASAATLTGRIRDFRDTHPDFESVIGGLQTGQVGATLVGGKPQFVGPAKPGFTTAGNFDQWYRDVDGVNAGRAFDLTLADIGGGLSQFSDSSFFPIDGELFGNEGRAHNYHFTVELNGRFSFKDGDKFDFSGDDDVWVFVDDKLALDLGGVHAPLSASFTSADLVALGLVAGETYDLDIFFAERHTVQSNFKITTSLAVTPVPVPAALPLLAAAFGGLGFWGRRRARKA
jgi:fibro-slime domain-containing protein